MLQGPYALNTYGNGVSCQGATFSISPFLMNSGNKSDDPESFATHNGNWGISAGLNIPLDGNLMDLCRRRAAVEIARQQSEYEKSRLDFELVRLKLCGEQIRSGVFFHPESPYGKICADIIATAPNGHIMTGNGIVASESTKK